MHVSRFTIVAFVLLAAQGIEAQTLIDNFSVGQSALAATPTNGSSLVGTMLGGERDMRAHRFAGSGMASVEVSSGHLVFSGSAGTAAEARVVWDGVDGDSAAISFGGLGGLDLTAGGADSIVLDVASASAGSVALIEVFSGPQAASVYAFRLPAVTTPTTFALPFGDFVEHFGGGAVFSSLGAVVLTVRGQGATLSLDAIRADVGPSAEIFATKTVALTTDVNGNAIVNPGDTLKYTLQVGNRAGRPSPGNTSLTDVLSADLTLVAGSVEASPIAHADYSFGPSTSVSVSAGGVLSNDTDPDGDALSVAVSGSVITSTGATASLGADGSYSLTAPSDGTLDTFQYEVTDGNGITSFAVVVVGYVPVAAAPVISPNGGAFQDSVSVSASTTTSGATIRYTTNGADPTTESTLYTAPVMLTASATVKAKTFVAGWTSSSTASASFDIALPTETPTFSPSQGYFTSAQSVTIQSTTPAATIRYTVDGSIPTATSPTYASPVEILSPTTLKAIAFKSGLRASAVSTAFLDVNPFNRQLWVGPVDTVLLDDQGRAWAWGLNLYDELGVGVSPAFEPQRAPHLDRARDLSSNYHTVWIDENRAVWALGLDTQGQSSGTPGYFVRPHAEVPGVPLARSVRVGSYYSAAISTDNKVWVWGDNSRGGHGLGHSDPAAAASEVPNLANVSQIQALPAALIALRLDGTVVSWGGDEINADRSTPTAVVGLPSIRSLNQGIGPIAAVDAVGHVWTWGWDAATHTVVASPFAMPATLECDGGSGTPGSPITGVVEVRGAVLRFEGGSRRSIIPDPCSNGDGVQATTRLISIDGNVVVADSFYDETYVAVTDQGGVWTWGTTRLGDQGAARPGDPQPIVSGAYLWRSVVPAIEPPGYVIDRPVSVGISCPDLDGASIRYTLDGTEPTINSSALACGNSIQVSPGKTLKVAIARNGFLSTVVTEKYPGKGGIAAGPNHYLVVTGSGSVYGWGDNSNGVVGDGTTAARPSPTLALLDQAFAVAAGTSHSLAVRTNGTVWSWGANASGQLGDGSLVARPTPAIVSGLSDVTSVVAGEAHSIALRSDGTVWSWGSNAYGQLGDGTQQSRFSPVQVPALSGIVAIAAGRNHSLALDGDGNLWVWGRNDKGQVGNGTLVDQVSPVTVQVGDQPVSAIAAGDEHTLALGDGLWGWGRGWGMVPKIAEVAADSGEGCDGTPLSASPFEGGGNHTLARGLFTDEPVGVFSFAGTRLQRDFESGNCDVPPPVLADETDPVVQLSAAGVRNVAVTLAGVVWTWENESASADPTQVIGTDGEVRPLAPTFSLLAGTYHEERSVTITASNPGATIYFTLDGSQPDQTSESLMSGGAVQITQDTTLAAIAVVAGMPPSDARIAFYTLVPDLRIDGPVGKYHGPYDIHVSSSTPGVTFTYQTGLGIMSVPPSGVVTVAPPIYFTVRASREGWTDAVIDRYATLGVATPVISPPGGSFSGPVDVTITSATPGATFLYLLMPVGSEGSSPRTLGSGETLRVPSSSFLYVVAERDGLLNSDPAVAQFTFILAAPTIVVDRQGGPNAPAYVFGSTSTPGGTVRCTFNGNDPTQQSDLCDRGVPIAKTTTVRARAFLPGELPSPVVERTVFVTGGFVEPPRISLPSGRYPATRYVSVTAGEGTTVRFTTDGSEPTLASDTVPVDGKVPIEASGTLRARAWVAAGASLTTSAEYFLSGQIVGAQTIAILKTDGSVWSWGRDQGRVGAGTSSIATPTPALVADSVIKLAAGSDFTAALKRDGTVSVWSVGLTAAATLPVSDIVDIAVAERRGAALGSTGALYVWPISAFPSGPPVPELLSYAGCARLIGSGDSLLCVGTDGYPRAIDQVGGNWSVAAPGVSPSDDIISSCLWAGFSTDTNQFGCGGTRTLEAFGGRTGRLTGVATDLMDLSSDLMVTAMGDVRDAAATSLFYSAPSPGRLFTTLTPSVGVGHRSVIRADGTLWRWGSNYFGEMASPDGFNVHVPDTPLEHALEVPAGRAFTDAWALSDGDNDGLLNFQEVFLGSNPNDPDTNRDGINDGLAVVIGRELLSRDLDGDGLSNDVEIALGTDMLRADSDGDGVLDGADAFPLDSSRSAAGPVNPADTQPPTITLRTPVGAVLISTNPGGVE